MQHYCPLISTTTTTDSQLSLLLQLGRLRRHTTIGFVTILLLYYLISLITSLLWRSYHKYPCQLSLFQADCDLEDDFQFSSNFHTFIFPSSCISSIINSHFQGWTCWAFAKTPGTARMIVGNNSAKAARKGKELTSSWGPSLLAGGWGPPPVIRVVMGRSIAILFRLVYHDLSLLRIRRWSIIILDWASNTGIYREYLGMLIQLLQRFDTFCQWMKTLLECIGMPHGRFAQGTGWGNGWPHVPRELASMEGEKRSAW